MCAAQCERPEPTEMRAVEARSVHVRTASYLEYPCACQSRAIVTIERQARLLPAMNSPPRRTA